MRILKYSLLPAFRSFFSTPSYSQELKEIPPEKPKIIVGIVVSQMRYDYIQRFWDKMDENGIKCW